MNKQEFLDQLRKGLWGIPQDDIEERITFYSEMIDDRMEEGLTEEEAVSAVGSVDDITRQVIADIPLTKIAKERIKPKRQLKAWEIVLLALGSPIWLSLGIATVAVIFSLYIVLWSIIIALWAVFVSFVACAFSCVASGIVVTVIGNIFSGMALLATGLIFAGLSIFMFYGCLAVTKCILILTKKIAVWIKNCFIKKEEL